MTHNLDQLIKYPSTFHPSEGVWYKWRHNKKYKIICGFAIGFYFCLLSFSCLKCFLPCPFSCKKSIIFFQSSPSIMVKEHFSFFLLQSSWRQEEWAPWTYCKDLKFISCASIILWVTYINSLKVMLRIWTNYCIPLVLLEKCQIGSIF